MKPTKETVIRTIVFWLGIVNMILEHTGHSVIPVSNENITEFITLLWLIVGGCWAWWKNNSFTAEAIRADEFLKSMRVKK